VDADNILMNPYTLQHLISADQIVVAPMLSTLSSYSNFWCGQDEKVSILTCFDFTERAALTLMPVTMTSPLIKCLMLELDLFVSEVRLLYATCCRPLLRVRSSEVEKLSIVENR